MTFDLDIWPTGLTINRDHLLIKDYLPTKFEVSYIPSLKFLGQSVPSYPLHNVWETDMTFDLDLDYPIGIIYSSRTIYLRSLKLLGQSVPELSVAQCLKDWHDLWLLTWLSIGSSTHQDYLPTKFEVSGTKRSRVIRCTMFERLTWPLILTLTINRDHLLIKDYLPTKFEASGTKRSRVIRCTMFERLTWPLTYWPDYP